MAQAPAANPTDDLLSQLAASEIDRLLAEADKTTPADKPASAPAVVVDPEPAPAPVATASTETVTEGLEKEALLKAAGFESDDKHPIDPASGDTPSGEERSALLKAAGFESIDEAMDSAEPARALAPEIKPDVHAEKPLPMYLKALIWINTPLESRSEKTRQILGTVGVATFVNAVAALTYLMIHHKH